MWQACAADRTDGGSNMNVTASMMGDQIAMRSSVLTLSLFAWPCSLLVSTDDDDAGAN